MLLSSGSLSSENTHTGTSFLSQLTRIERNKKNSKPSAALVLDRYLKKFSKPKDGEDVMDLPGDITTLESDHEGDGEEDDEEEAPVVADQAGPSGATDADEAVEIEA